VEPALRGATLARGALDAALDVVLAPRETAGPRLEVAGGTVEARDLALALPSARTPSVTSRRVAVELAHVRLVPAFEAELARVRLTGATLRVTRDRNGRLDLQRLWTADAAPAASPPSPAPARRFAIRRIELAEGRVDFTDDGVTPAFSETLRDLAVDVRQSGDGPGRMEVQLRGRLGEAVPLEAEGWATPFADALRFQGRAVVRDFELATLNPYLGRFVGHRVEQGHVSAEVAGSYGDGRYTADPRVTIRQLRLGDQTGPGLDLGIPLEQALALLEDSRGDIELRVPITGGAGGTEFEIRHVVLAALRNTLVKTLAAPFRMFGSLLTRGERIGEVRINPIEFRPGTLEPDDDASARLADVIEFLKERPRLGLQLRGVATQEEVDGLKRERLREALRKTPPVPDTPLVAVYRGAGGGAGRSLPPEAEMQRFVLERMRVTADDLRALAAQRGRVIQEALARSGIEPQRLALVREGAASLADAGAGRVEFELR
jgi:hypothetical protein